MDKWCYDLSALALGENVQNNPGGPSNVEPNEMDQVIEQDAQIPGTHPHATQVSTKNFVRSSSGHQP